MHLNVFTDIQHVFCMILSRPLCIIPYGFHEVFILTSSYYTLSIYRGYIWHDNAHSKTIIMTSVRFACTHEQHPIPRPYGRARGCLSWVIRRKITATYRYPANQVSISSSAVRVMSITKYELMHRNFKPPKFLSIHRSVCSNYPTVLKLSFKGWMIKVSVSSGKGLATNRQQL